MGFYDDLSRLSSDLTITICKCVSPPTFTIFIMMPCHGVTRGLGLMSLGPVWPSDVCTGLRRPESQAPAPGNSPTLGPQQHPQPIAAEHWEVIIKLNCLTRSWTIELLTCLKSEFFLNIVKDCKTRSQRSSAVSLWDPKTVQQNPKLCWN